jgi:hypothetical protein
MKHEKGSKRFQGAFFMSECCIDGRAYRLYFINYITTPSCLESAGIKLVNPSGYTAESGTSVLTDIDISAGANSDLNLSLPSGLYSIRITATGGYDWTNEFCVIHVISTNVSFKPGYVYDLGLGNEYQGAGFYVGTFNGNDSCWIASNVGMYFAINTGRFRKIV